MGEKRYPLGCRSFGLYLAGKCHTWLLRASLGYAYCVGDSEGCEVASVRIPFLSEWLDREVARRVQQCLNGQREVVYSLVEAERELGERLDRINQTVPVISHYHQDVDSLREDMRRYSRELAEVRDGLRRLQGTGPLSRRVGFRV